MKLIDTDVLIDHFHGHQAALDFLIQEIVKGETLAISVVTITEFTGGMRKGEESRTERLLSLFTPLKIDRGPKTEDRQQTLPRSPVSRLRSSLTKDFHYRCRAAG